MYFTVLYVTNDRMTHPWMYNMNMSYDTCTLTPSHTHTHAHTHTYIHTHTYAHAHTRTPQVYGVTPFRGVRRDETFENVIKAPLRFPSKPQVSEECQDLISQLLIKDPASRLGTRSGACACVLACTCVCACVCVSVSICVSKSVCVRGYVCIFKCVHTCVTCSSTARPSRNAQCAHQCQSTTTISCCVNLVAVYLTS